MDRWYAIHSQPRAEARAAHHLRNQEFDVYLPRYRKRIRHARRTEVVRSPLFPRYLFVRMDVEERQWRSINGTVGVQYLVCNGELPVPIPDAVIDSIRARENEDGTVQLSPASFRRGQPLRIVDGPLAELSGLFENMVDEERVMLLLDLMGRQVRIRLPVHSVALDH